MPLIKSAIKKMRQDRQRTARNRRQRANLRKSIKTVEKAILKKETENLTKNFQLAQKKIDKAVKKNLLHVRTGSRRKSRLAKKVQSLKSKV
jgi:small subunit ribosomal protein S20